MDFNHISEVTEEIQKCYSFKQEPGRPQKFRRVTFEKFSFEMRGHCVQQSIMKRDTVPNYDRLQE